MLNKLNLYVSFICVIILGNYCVKAEYEDEDNESSVVRIIDVDDNLRNSINIKIESLKSDFKEVFGSVRIIIKIDPSGQITKIDVIQNNLGDPEFIQDIEKNIKLWQFESSLVPKKGISVRFNVFFGKGGYTNNRILGCVGPILANNGMGFSLDIFR